MPADLQSGYDRIGAARKQLIDVRDGRVRDLLRLLEYLKVQLAQFLVTTDPVTGARLADLGSEGSKVHGDMTMSLAFFEGSRWKISVGADGRFAHLSEPAAIFAHIGDILEVRVSADLSSAELVYLPAGGESPTTRTTPVDEFVETLLRNAVEAVEAQVLAADPRGTVSVPAS